MRLRQLLRYFHLLCSISVWLVPRKPHEVSHTPDIHPSANQTLDRIPAANAEIPHIKKPKQHRNLIPVYPTQTYEAKANNAAQSRHHCIPLCHILHVELGLCENLFIQGWTIDDGWQCSAGYVGVVNELAYTVAVLWQCDDWLGLRWSVLAVYF